MTCEKAFVDRVMQRLEMRLLLQSSEKKKQASAGATEVEVEDEEVCAAPPSPLLDQLSEPLAAVIANASREAFSPSSGVEGGAAVECHRGLEGEGLAGCSAGIVQQPGPLASDGICLDLEESVTRPAGTKVQALLDGLSKASVQTPPPSERELGSLTEPYGTSTRDVSSGSRVVVSDSSDGSGRLPHLPPMLSVGGSGNDVSTTELWKLPAENAVQGSSLDVSAVHIGQFRWVKSVTLCSGGWVKVRG